MPPDDTVSSATRWRAQLALRFERRGERSVLAERRHDGPLVVQKALHPEGAEVCHAIVVHPPAGIAGGDELLIDVRAQARSHALLTTPGAGKWYRSAGAWARQRVSIAAAQSSAVEWLPQETILYDGARADIAWHAQLAADARLIAWDIVCLGRSGSGEGFGRVQLRLDTRLERAGRLVWHERARLEPGAVLADSPAGLAGATVFGTFIAAAPALDDACLASCRGLAPRRGEAAATRLPGVLLVRYRGDSGESAREHFTAIWRRLRAPLLGRDAVEPRIWRT